MKNVTYFEGIVLNQIYRLLSEILPFHDEIFIEKVFHV